MLHGVCISENFITTAKGTILIPPSIRVLLAILLEAYPQTIKTSSIEMTHENVVSDKSLTPIDSLRARLTLYRPKLKAIGLHIVNVWGYGYRLEIDK